MVCIKTDYQNGDHTRIHYVVTVLKYTPLVNRREHIKGAIRFLFGIRNNFIELNSD